MTPPRLPEIVLAALVAGLLLNVVQFPFIESRVSENWRAINTYGTSDLDRYPHAERRYGFFLALGEVAPGATLIVPPNRSPAPTRLESFQPRIFGLARIADYERRDYDPLEIMGTFDPSEHVVREGAYEGGSFRIAVAEGDADRLVFAMEDDQELLIVDERLLPTSIREDLSS